MVITQNASKGGDTNAHAKIEVLAVLILRAIIVYNSYDF